MRQYGLTGLAFDLEDSDGVGAFDAWIAKSDIGTVDFAIAPVIDRT